MINLSEILKRSENYGLVDTGIEARIEEFVNHRLKGLKYVGAKKSYAVTRYYIEFTDPMMTKFYTGTRKSQTSSMFQALINSSSCSLSQEGSNLVLDVANNDDERGTLLLGDGVVSLEKIEKQPDELLCYVGESANGNPVVLNLADEAAPHLLIAGGTGSGKSSTLHSILTTLLARYDEKELLVDFVDMKVVTASVYKGIKQVKNIVTERDDVEGYFGQKLAEMENRMRILEEAGEYQSVNEYNCDVDEDRRIPHLIVVVDEADQLLDKAHNDDVSKSIKSAVKDLAAMGRASGIHLIIASQKAVSTNIPTNILSNLPGRIALKASSKMDSNLLIGDKAATELKGRGDAFVRQNRIDAEALVRTQVAYLDLSDRRVALEALRKI